jgi:hypothetical protein
MINNLGSSRSEYKILLGSVLLLEQQVTFAHLLATEARESDHVLNMIIIHVNN